MRASHWGSWMCLGLAVWGCGGSQEGETPLAAEQTREVNAQACPVGVASRVKVVHPPGPTTYATLNELTDVQGKLYFTTLSGPSNNTGATLWSSDGTEAGTVRVRAFGESISRLEELVAVGNKLFFQFYEPNTDTEQLWASEGTSGTTRFVKAFTSDVYIDSMIHPTTVNGRLLFFHPIAETETEPFRVELWRSDGTDVGTRRVGNFSEYIAGFNLPEPLLAGNALLFIRIQDSGTSLWRTDGTVAGTRSLMQLDAGRASLHEVGRAGSLGLFTLYDFPNYEFWKTDGTEAGTVRLESFGHSVRLLGVLDGGVYLSSVEEATQRVSIHRLSLNGGEKTRVTTLPNNDTGLYTYVQRATVSGGRIYFSVAFVGEGSEPERVELWALQGASSASRPTRLFSSLSRGDVFTSSPLFATGEGPVLFTGSSTGLSAEPWFTRGTVATTGQLADIGPGLTGSATQEFVRVGSRVYFPATDDTGLPQLWSVPASFTCPAGLSQTQE
ncbi:hypothetical protein [Corallococcus terminator]|uniref:Uncharacterized protein n=1 Tax=Corallococcus terminator TaxID=2316733 RepID=A0A3A8J0Y4_9BACT|nr:hypothetical protein [Corallococcus terminator]RKG89322.1 hypothetical protein D7V88_12925 [Corallococcus terminator]